MVLGLSHLQSRVETGEAGPWTLLLAPAGHIDPRLQAYTTHHTVLLGVVLLPLTPTNTTHNQISNNFDTMLPSDSLHCVCNIGFLNNYQCIMY